MKQPNIVYILADDMGYGDVSYLNERAAFTTPNMDRMCEEGLHFRDAHATSAVCTPSRYSILTGRYNWRSALKEGVLFGYDTPLIEKERPTVASYLKNQGYQTACVGKWHLGLTWPLKDPDDKESIIFEKPLLDGPTDHGFDYFYGIAGSLDMPPYVYIENKNVTAVPDRIVECERTMPVDSTKHWFRTGLTGSDFVHEEVLTKLTEKALDKIEAFKDDPFFLYFPITGPHTPILPTEEFRGKSGTTAYGDFVLMCDDVVGQVNDKLEALGIAENTIVIFTSDNGCSPMANFPELSQYGHNPSYIFRGTKADIFEGGHRIPLIIKWPEGIKKGTNTNAPTCLVDFFATVVDVLEDRSSTAGEDSVSQYELWKNPSQEKSQRKWMVHHSINGSFSVRKDQWKLIMCPDSGGWSQPLPGTMPDNAIPVQLYNLEDDIREQYNLAEGHPEIVAELSDLLKSTIGSDTVK